jgi:hypothetical protein
MITLTEKAKRLILSFEGLDQPFRWPRGGSGISIGHGYDLGYTTVAEFEKDWGGYLPPGELLRLKAVVGLKGESARSHAYKFVDIWIDKFAADEVFVNSSMPKYIKMTEGAFPSVDSLLPDAQGALVSLVYNRGDSMEGDRRREMRNIREAVKVGDLQTIADQIRSMKRLWVGKGLDGLLRRRDAEADLVESCIT